MSTELYLINRVSQAGYNTLAALVSNILIRFTSSTENEIRLLEAIVKDDILTIRTLANSTGTDFETTRVHRYKFTPLLHAIDCSSPKSVNELLALGIDVNNPSKDRDKVTPLYLAVREATPHLFRPTEIKVAIIQQLLQGKANPNQAIKGGTTPIFSACYSANMPVAKLLVQFGAKLDIIDSRKNTPLDVAIQIHGEDSEIAQFIRQNGGLPCMEKVPKSMKLHHHIDAEHIFSNGTFHPNKTRKQIMHYHGDESYIKKYDSRFFSLFRSIIRGTYGFYTIYDPHAFITSCKGCLNGISKNIYLGEGGEAKIKIGQNISTKEFVAIRVTQEPFHSPEIKALRLLGLYRDHISTNNKHYIVEELIDGTSLSSFWFGQHSSANDGEQALLKIIHQILFQVALLHRYNLVHRDLSSSNIMINCDTLKVNVIDFGHTVSIPDGQSTVDCENSIVKFGMSLAPELTNRKEDAPYPYSKETDIYTLSDIISRLHRSYSSHDRKCSAGTETTIANICKNMSAREPSKRGTAQKYLAEIESLMPQQQSHSTRTAITMSYILR